MPHAVRKRHGDNDSCVYCLFVHRAMNDLIVDGDRQIPKRADNSSDTIQMDLRLLLPRTSTPINLGMFVTNIPMFKHVVGNLSNVFFEHFKIVDPGSSITVGVRTPMSSHGQGSMNLTRLSLVHYCSITPGSDVRRRDLREFQRL